MAFAVESPAVDDRAARSSWRDWFAGGRGDGYLCAAVLFLSYATLSLLQHRELHSSGFDLGIFDQAVRNYAHFHSGVSDIKGLGFNLLGDHFHPILVLLVPLYWLHSSATTLLVAQAGLVAISILPVHRLAQARLGRRGAVAVAVAYGLSFGVQTAIAFDFHEVAFAAPLLAFSLVALVEQRWRACLLWALPLLLVREEMGLYLAALGVVLVIRRQRRLGVWLAVAGVLAFAFMVGIVVPHFNPTHTNPYLAYFTSGPQGAEYLVSGPQGHPNLLAAILEAPWHLVNSPDKLKTLLLLAAVTAFLALRSPIMLLALVNIGIRFTGNNPLFWTSFSWDYGLVLMPVVFIAYLDAYPAWQRNRSGLIRRYATWSPWMALAVALVVSVRLPLLPYLVHAPGHVQLSARVQAADEMINRVPDGVLVEASNDIAPHLTDRADVVMWPFTQVDTDWVLVDTTDPVYVSRGEQAHVIDLEHRGYVQLEAREGFLLLRAPGH